MNGFGAVVRTGLTDPRKPVNEAAFTPCRNLLFLTLGASIAHQRGVGNIVLGLLSETTAIFPDQTDAFLRAAENTVSVALGYDMAIFCPLRDFTKKDVVRLAQDLDIQEYYSCHAGGDKPCGQCIACLEYL